MLKVIYKNNQKLLDKTILLWYNNLVVKKQIE